MKRLKSLALSLLILVVSSSCNKGLQSPKKTTATLKAKSTQKLPELPLEKPELSLAINSTEKQGEEAFAPLYEQVLSKSIPANETVVSQNPPSLIWPGDKKKKYLYRIQLSSSPEFSPETTIVSDVKAWCMYTHHEALAEGKWYWRWQRKETDQWQDRSSTQTFHIDKSSYQRQVKSFTDFLSSVPNVHP
ncbi:MAG: DUF4962 domain-containing protein, partial [Lentisphaerales bacterium]|nr:DUF4962 domain-containing protein [Lentisphaerales bacterium]